MKDTLEKVAAVGGGVGVGSVQALFRELQGLNISLLAGGLANAKLALAAIRQEDTIVAALNNNAGTLTDITNTMSISAIKATGTVTVANNTPADTVSVNGLTYTLVANDAVVGALDFSKVKVGADVNACAANLAAAINAREAQRIGGTTLSAAAVADVVTITADADGTAGNTYALAETGASFTVSGATLSGGTATGGVSSTGATDQVILFWFNKQ